MKIMRKIIIITYSIDKISSPVRDDSFFSGGDTSIFIFHF